MRSHYSVMPMIFNRWKILCWAMTFNMKKRITNKVTLGGLQNRENLNTPVYGLQFSCRFKFYKFAHSHTHHQLLTTIPLIEICTGSFLLLGLDLWQNARLFLDL